ncbi:beta-microseminoprotein-like [Anomaloglossus baeobatrachus]|uniref:beta-microseminoprotein-like n=1 Tax=Anomaloglossus baeobatrachus TaxID=238106 RepID=UPI003F50B4B3
MKFLITIAFGTGILVVLCNAACFRKESKIKAGGEPEGCYFRKKMHPLNSQWRTNDCLDCSCYSSGSVECCTAYGRPVNYDEERCNFVFDEQDCEYKLIPNEDPNKQCESYGMVG